MRYFLIVFTFFLQAAALSQTKQSYKKLNTIHPVGTHRNTVYVLLTKNRGWELACYSADTFGLMHTVLLNNHEGNHSRKLEAVLMLDTLPSYVTSYTNVHKGECVYELFSIRNDSVLPAVMLARLSTKSILHDPAARHSLLMEWCQSSNRKYTAFSFQDQDNMSSSSHRIVSVYDQQCHLTYSVPLDLRYPQNVTHLEFDVNAQLTLLNDGTLAHKKLTTVSFYDAHSSFEVQLREVSDNYEVCELFNGTLVICGLSINSPSGFMEIIGKNHRDTVIHQNFMFDKAPEYRLRKIYVQSDGSMLLFTQQLRTKTVRRTTLNNSRNSSITGSRNNYTTYISEDGIRVVGLSSGGNVLWLKNWSSDGRLQAKERGLCIVNNGVKTDFYYNKMSEGKLEVRRLKVSGNIEIETKVFEDLERPAVLPAYCCAFDTGCLLFSKKYFTFIQL